MRYNPPMGHLKLRTMSIRLPLSVASALEEFASKRGLTLSEAGRLLIEQGLLERTAERMNLEEHLRQKAETALAKAANRLADLVARTAIASLESRFVVESIHAILDQTSSLVELDRAARAYAQKRLKDFNLRWDEQQ